MREIPISRTSLIAKIDDIDWPLVSLFKWSISPYSKRHAHTFYPWTEFQHEGKRYRFYLHRFILNAPPDLVVDHVDGDALNNLRANLRLCSRKDNQGNRRKCIKSATSEFKGIYYKRGRWIAQIGKQRQVYYIGSYVNEMDAVNAYNQAAIEYFGEFAKNINPKPKRRKHGNY